MSEKRLSEQLRGKRVYVIRSIEGRPRRVPPPTQPVDYVPPTPTEDDRILARALLARRSSTQGET